MDEVRARMTPKDLAALAREALEASKFDLAEQHAREMVRIDPDQPQGLALLAEALASAGKGEEAFGLLDQIADAFPDDAKMAAHARNLARTHGDMDRAIAHARRVQLLNPLDSKNLVFLIQSAIDRGEPEVAIADIARLEAIAPDEPRKDALLARAQWQLGRLEQARQTVRYALDNHADNADTLSQLLRLAGNVHEIADPVEIASRLLELRPHHVGALKAMLRAARAASELDMVLHWSSTLVEAEPSRPAWFVGHAKALLALERPIDALECLRNGIDLHPLDMSLLSAARDAALKADSPEEAVGYARSLERIAPGDPRNNAFLTWISLRDCDFEAALETSSRLVSLSPEYVAGWRLHAQALSALFRVREALDSLDEAIAAHPDDAKLTKAQLNVAFHHGHFERSIELARQRLVHPSADASTHVSLVQSHMALGQIDEARKHLAAVKAAETHGPLRKLVHHADKLEKLRTTAPVVVEAWLTALRNRRALPDQRNSPQPTVMIQYWSQGAPPRDVAYVVDQWRRLLAEEELGEVALFDRISGRDWIEEHAPDFLGAFDKAFHFAMESDIFRIAFASRRPCIYMDIDSWPLEHTAEVLRYGMAQTGSLLYFRSYQPWLVNGFFISRPDCQFIRTLVDQTLSLDLDSMEKNHITIDTSFGPTRFNVVVKDLIAQNVTSQVDPTDAYGCSRLTLDGGVLHFVHEAAVAAVRPPFDLGYKGTGDYWKRFMADA